MTVGVQFPGAQEVVVRSLPVLASVDSDVTWRNFGNAKAG